MSVNLWTFFKHLTHPQATRDASEFVFMLVRNKSIIKIFLWGGGGWSGVMLITCVLLWCFYQLFGLSFWRHPFTAEDPIFGWTIPLSPEFPSWGRVRCNDYSICIVGGLPETNYIFFQLHAQIATVFYNCDRIFKILIKFTAIYKLNKNIK